MTNQPSDAAKDLSHRIVCEFRPDGWAAKEIEIAHLIDRHREQAVAEERAKIVTWLRGRFDLWGLEDNWANYWAGEIEAGEQAA